MTLLDRGLPTALSQHLPLSALEARWSSLRMTDGGRRSVIRSELVLQVRLIDREHALVEAWVESQLHRRSVLATTPMRIVLEQCQRWVHVDVLDDGQALPQRIAALSMPVSQSTTDAPSTMAYAHTTLLQLAGFAPGTHDRPRVVVHQPSLNMASA